MTFGAKAGELSRTLEELKVLREACLQMERQFQSSIDAVCPESKCSAQNLLHYLALRTHDLRDLQVRLAALGLSSLGRSESNALAALNAVIAVLEKLNNEQILKTSARRALISAPDLRCSRNNRSGCLVRYPWGVSSALWLPCRRRPLSLTNW